MREIIFKAKRIDNGEWVEGYIGKYDNPDDTTDLIIIPINKVCENGISWYLIDESSICQFTGLLDKNGRKIWENDICRYVDGDECGIKEETFVVKYGRHAELCKINMGFYIDWIKTDYYRCDLVFWTENRKIEVIGTTFDNPELLKGGE